MIKQELTQTSRIILKVECRNSDGFRALNVVEHIIHEKTFFCPEVECFQNMNVNLWIGFHHSQVGGYNHAIE